MTEPPYMKTLNASEQFTGADADHGLIALDDPGPSLRARALEVFCRPGGGTVAGDDVTLVTLEMFNPDGGAAVTEVVEVRRWENVAEAIFSCQYPVPPGWQLRFLTPVLAFEMTVCIDFDPASLIGGGSS